MGRFFLFLQNFAGMGSMIFFGKQGHKRKEWLLIPQFNLLVCLLNVDARRFLTPISSGTERKEPFSPADRTKLVRSVFDQVFSAIPLTSCTILLAYGLFIVFRLDGAREFPRNADPARLLVLKVTSSRYVWGKQLKKRVYKGKR